MGCGKSVLATEIIAELSKDGNILLSVPSGEIALEYQARFLKLGVKPFLLFSHENTFGHQKKKKVSLTNELCPRFDEIQNEISLGSSDYKEDICSSCPLKAERRCPFIEQYTNVMEPKYSVVIIQHAHFGTKEVLYKLLSKEFMALFIDETFINDVVQIVPIQPTELEVLEGTELEWARRLLNWLKGTEPATGKLTPSKNDLNDLREAFKSFKNCNWRIPDLIRHYNQHRIVNSDTGIEVVYELPNTPYKVLLDATPPIEIIKHIIGVDTLIVEGDKEVVDITAIHPGNRRVQLLDITNSKKKLSNEDFFGVLMKKICEIVKAEYVDKKVLITAYDSNTRMIEDYISDNYPDIVPFIDIGLMNKGTNRWADFDCQFILAGRYRIAKMYYQEAYKLVTGANYFRTKRGLQPFRVHDPASISSKAILETDSHLVTINMIKKSGYVEVEYPEFGYFKPRQSSDPNDPYYWFNLIYDMDLDVMQQVERIRWTEDTPKTVYHLHNLPMKHLVFTDAITFKQFLDI